MAKGRFSGVVRLTAILCGVFFCREYYVHSDRFFTCRPVANYRGDHQEQAQALALANMSCAGREAGRGAPDLAGMEDLARGALPDLVARAAVADGCRIEPGAVLEWLVTEAPSAGNSACCQR